MFGLIMLWVSAAGCAREKGPGDELVRVGGLGVSVIEFDQAVRLAKEEVFPGEAEIDPAMLGELNLRVLNQMSEELVLAAYAADHGIALSDEELATAVAAIKEDYPDDTFNETLLENAVSYALWERRLAARLLAEKVIARALVDKVRISAEDVTEYYRKYYPDGIPDTENLEDIQQRIVVHLRRHKGEEAYKAWIISLGATYPVEINQQAWERWVGQQ